MRKVWKRYIDNLLGRYSINLKEEHSKPLKSQLEMQSFNDIMNSSRPCGLLSGVYHFHLDLYENFIPQSCPGFSIKIDELIKGADQKSIRCFTVLRNSGVGTLQSGS